MKKRILFYATFLTGITIACNNAGTGNGTDVTDTNEDKAVTVEPEHNAPETYEKDGLKIYPADESPAYENAQLSMSAPKEGAKFETGEVKFNFGVENYELGIKTPDADSKGIANSDHGQHIHLIIDNDPYSAHYEPSFTKTYEPGHHVAIAFLSRSYHESVKNTNAYKVFQFTTGAKGAAAENTDLSQPMLFYSRPKGEYKGQDTKKVLFDFYVVNADLSSDGYSVLMTVNGKHTFEIDTWQPYYIEGLPMGENTIEIELVDAKGQKVNSPISGTTRTFTLTNQ